MRGLAVTVGAGVLGLLGAVVFWPVSRSGPEPIAYGRDACAACRMHLSQPGFAGEIRDAGGVLTKYDDIGCLLRVLGTRPEPVTAWVEDHGDASLVPLLAAHLVRIGPGATPMGGGVIAFREERAARTFAAANAGEVIALARALGDAGERAEP